MDFDIPFVVLWASITAIVSISLLLLVDKKEFSHRQEIESGDLIIIKANPKKAWPIWLLNTVLLAPLVVFILWMDKVKPLECSRVFEVNFVYLCLAILVFVMPVIFTVLIYYNWKIAKKSLQNGYFPPSDSVCMFKTQALSLRLKRVKFKVFFILYISPFVAVFFYVASFNIYQKLQLDRSYTLIEKDLEKKCLVIKHYP